MPTKNKYLFPFPLLPLSVISVLFLGIGLKLYSDFVNLDHSRSEALEHAEDAESGRNWGRGEDFYLEAVALAAKIESQRITWFDSYAKHMNLEELALRDLAQFYEQQGKYLDAEPIQKRILAIQERRGVQWSDDGLVALAGDYVREGRYADAEALYLRALAIVAKASSGDHQNAMIDWNELIDLDRLAQLYCEQGKYAEAEPLVKQILAKSPSTNLGSVAMLYIAQRKDSDAEAQLKQAISEKNFHTENNPFPDVGYANSLCGLADLYSKQGKYVQSESLYKQAIQVCEAGIAQAFYTPVTIISEMRNPLVDRKLRRWRDLGSTALYAMLAKNLVHLGDSYRVAHKVSQAEAIYHRALLIYEGAYEIALDKDVKVSKSSLAKTRPDYAEVFRRLGEIACEKGEYDLAESYFKPALAIDERALGLKAPDKVGILQSYAVLLRKTNRQAQADQLEKQAETIKSQVH